jgi:hypothetical protein
MLKIQETKNEVKSIIGGFMSMFDSYEREILRVSTFVAGGSIRSLLTGTKLNDVDIFFKYADAWTHIVKQLKKKGISYKYLGDRSYSKVVELNVGGLKLQLIGIQTECARDVVHRFDFTINTSFYDVAEDDLQVLYKTDLENRELRLLPNPNVLAISKLEDRVERFESYGFHMARSESKRLDVILSDYRTNKKWEEVRKEMEKLRQMPYRQILHTINVASVISPSIPYCDCGARHTNTKAHAIWCSSRNAE